MHTNIEMTLPRIRGARFLGYLVLGLEVVQAMQLMQVIMSRGKTDKSKIETKSDC